MKEVTARSLTSLNICTIALHHDIHLVCRRRMVVSRDQDRRLRLRRLAAEDIPNLK